MKSVWAAAGLLLFSSLFWLGCSDVLEPGHYEGILRESETRSPLGDIVALDLEFPSSRQGLLHVMNRQMKMTVKIDDISQAGFALTIPVIVHPPLFLQAQPQDGNQPDRRCFVASGDWKAEFCVESRFIKFRLVNSEGQNVFHLSASRFTVQPGLRLEESASYTLERAIDVALHNEQGADQADSRLASGYRGKFERMVQMASSRVHLPTLMSFVPGVPIFLLAEQLVSRQQAHPSGEKVNEQVLHKIQRDSLITNQANLVSVIEQGSYALNRDEQILALYIEGQKKVLEFQDQLRKVLPSESAGDVDRLDSLMTKLRAQELEFEKKVREDRLFLSLAMGLRNPEGVKSVVVPPLKFEGIGESLDAIDLGRVALSRSFELEQFNFQKVVSQQTGAELPVQWMNSNAAGIKLDLSDLSLEKMQTWVMSGATQVGIEYNYALENLNLWHGDLQRRPKDLDSIFNRTKAIVEEKKRFKNRHLSRRIRSFLKFKVQDISNEAAYRIARSKVDRVLLKGSLDLLLPQLETITAVEGQKGIALSPVVLPVGSFLAKSSPKLDPAPKVFEGKRAPQKTLKDHRKKGPSLSSLPSADADINPFKRTRQSSQETEKNLGADRGKESQLPELGVRWVPLE